MHNSTWEGYVSFRIIILVFCVALLAISLNASSETTAQSDSAWSVIIYDHGLNALVELSSSDGISVISLPDIGYPPRPVNNQYPGWYEDSQVKLTADRRYLVSIIHHTDPYLDEAVITNLNTQEVIFVPTPPLNDTERFFGYFLGEFNPTSTQIALPYIGYDDAYGGGVNFGGIAVVELATGRITHTLDMDATFQKPMAWLDHWTDEGIWFAPKCHFCDPGRRYTYFVWNPDTDTLVETQVFNEIRRLERLPATGEMLYSEVHSDYVLDRPIYSSPNIVALYQPDDNPPDVSGQVVYYDSHNVGFLPARWIMNGQGFLVPNRERHNVVVLRSGQQLTIDYAHAEYFIAMTSDGWLAFDRDLRQVNQYRVSQVGITRHTPYQAQGEIEVAHIYLSPNEEPLPPFAIDISPPDEFHCRGSLPSRLQPGDWAEVVFDAEGMITIHALVVGDVAFDEQTGEHVEPLPVGAHVQVLEGPVCTPDGLGHVKVQYQDLVGWTTEVWYTQYYLAPVPVPVSE